MSAPEWDGYPQDRERDGWHWLGSIDAPFMPPRPTLWLSASNEWVGRSDPEWIAGDTTYLGPCHTPAEVAALVDAARRDEREACAKVADGRGWASIKSLNADSYQQGLFDAADDCAAAIRALAEKEPRR